MHIAKARSRSVVTVVATTLRILWLLAALLVVCTTSWFDWHNSGNDTEGFALILLYLMGPLTFPTGTLALFAFALIALGWEKAGLPVVSSGKLELSFIFAWACMTAAGYWQWFVAVPWAYRRILARRQRLGR
jgi:hypothetical protein